MTTAPPQPSQLLTERVRGAWPLIAAGVAVVALGNDTGPILCPFRRCTGGYCPLCGITRSFGSLVRFDPVAAFAHYPVLPLVMAVPALARGWPRRRRLRDSMLATIGVAVAAIWVLRLAAGDIPRPNRLDWFW